MRTRQQVLLKEAGVTHCEEEEKGSEKLKLRRFAVVQTMDYIPLKQRLFALRKCLKVSSKRDFRSMKEWLGGISRRIRISPVCSLLGGCSD